MPCYTKITVQLKDENAVREACKNLGIDERHITKVGSEFQIDLTNESHTRAEFKIEYGMILATKQAKRKFGYKAHITRKIEEKTGNPYLNINLRNV